MSLNYNFFTKILSKNDKVNYTAYKLNSPGMVLFSLIDDKPLACLQFLTQDSNTNTIITERPNKSTSELMKFQGMINKDNKEFELVITNLSDSGYINFNIIKSNKDATKVNTQGLNYINELRPRESYSVKCDKSTKKAMILSADVNDNDDKTMLKVAENNKNTDSGTYLYLTVTPQNNNKKLCESYSKTTWKCPNVLIINSTLPKSRSRLSFYPSINNNILVSNTSYIEESYDMKESCDIDLYVPKKKKTLRKKKTLKPQMMDNIDNIISTSFVSTIKHGKEIKEHGVKTNVEYNYEKTSIKCIIGLSVSDKLVFIEQSIDELKDEADRMIKSYINNKYKTFLETSVYNSNECCICLEEKPDVVFYQCGHKCIHESCSKLLLRKCPLCRTSISALLTI